MAVAKTLFETTDWPVVRIAREAGVPPSTLYTQIAARGWARSVASRRTGTWRRRGVDERLMALLRRQILAAERGSRRATDLPEREREARLAASLTRSYLALEARRAAALPAPSAPQEEQGTAHDADTALAARPPDELRSMFAERLADLFHGRDRPALAGVAPGDRGVADAAMDHARP